MFKRLKSFKKRVKPPRTYEQKEESSYSQKDAGDPSKVEELAAADRTVYLFPASIKEVGGNRWGYMNTKGSFVHPAIYDEAGDFQENGLAIVHLNGIAGVVDVNGYYLVKPQYERIDPFSEGRAAVIDKKGYKVIDESGKELTSKAYSYVGKYQEGRIVFADKDAEGHWIYGYLNKRGKEVIPPAYESASDFNNGKAVVRMKGGSYALINLTGKVICTYPAAFVGGYGNGLLVFQKKAGGKYGYADEQGNIIIAPKYTEAKPFIEARAIVMENDRYGLIDRKGQYIFKPNYHHILHLGEGRIAIGKAIHPDKSAKGMIYAVADMSGHILTGFIYNKIMKYEGGKASAYNDQQTFFIDKNGNKVDDLLIAKGSGKLHIDKKLIKAEIDARLFYYKKNGFLIWKQNTEIALNDQYTVLENKYKPNKDFLVYYPQIKGMADKKTQAKINQMLKDLAGLKETSPYLQLELNYLGDFQIPFYKRDLVVFEMTGYHYSLGTAHGLPIRKYIHIDLKTGEVFHLKDLFKPGSQYVKVISEIIGKQIQNSGKYSYILPGSFKGIEVDQPFFISKGCLNLYFSPYEIAPHAAEFSTFSIPVEELLRMIDQMGSFWQAFN